MSKKHFIALADAIREHNTSFPHDALSGMQIQILGDFCKGQNPNFKINRWLDYIAGKCGPNGGAR